MDDREVDFEILEEALREALHGRFAGLWVEDSGAHLPDRIHVAVAGLHNELEEAARLPMTQHAAGVDYMLHPVSFTEEELYGFVAPLLSLSADGDTPDELTGVGVDVTQNAVVVSVSSNPGPRLAHLLDDIPADALQLTRADYRPL